LNLKVAVLFFIVLASTITATAVVLSNPPQISIRTREGIVANSSSLVEPQDGDPIDDPAPPHVPYRPSP